MDDTVAGLLALVGLVLLGTTLVLAGAGVALVLGLLPWGVGMGTVGLLAFGVAAYGTVRLPVT
ncbi:hypothetical protein ACFQH6_00340 [Halobacteriaceae archaeon GCM10025711]